MPFELFTRPLSPRSVRHPSVFVNPNGRITLRHMALDAMGYPPRLFFVTDFPRWGIKGTDEESGEHITYATERHGMVSCSPLVHRLRLDGEYLLARVDDPDVGVFFEAVRP